MLVSEKSWRLLRVIAPAGRYLRFRNLNRYRADQYAGAFQYLSLLVGARKEEHLVGTVHIPSLLATAVVSLAVVAHADDGTTEEQNETRKMIQNTLQRLYKADPKIKAAIEGAAGYAIVSSTG